MISHPSSLSQDYLTRFFNNQNLVDESNSLVRLNSNTITEKSFRDSFLDDPNEARCAHRQALLSNMRLLEEIGKNQVLLIHDG